MTSERCESISEDWQELDSAASVISFDELSRSSSPAPFEAETPAIVTAVVEGPPSIVTQLPLRPKNDDQESSSTAIHHIVDTRHHSSPNESRPAQPLQPGGLTPNVPHQYAATSIASETQDIPVRLKGKAHDTSSSFLENRDYCPKDSGHEKSEVDEGQDETDIDTVTNPRECFEACTEVITFLSDVAKLAHDIGGHRISTMSHIRQVCERLSVQTKELNEMLEVYAKHWMAHGSRTDMLEIPFNPDVREILTVLSRQLLRTSAELKGATPQEGVTLEVQDMPLYKNSTFARCGDSLEGISDCFADFLPIMKVDFDEFKTKNMSFPLATTDSSRNASLHPPPHPAVNRIRQELYTLKDCFLSIIDFLTKLTTASSFPRAIDSHIFNTMVAIVQVITRILTNNPSEWIDSDTGSSEKGCISYTHFLTLDPEILHDIAEHLKSYQKELDIEPGQEIGICSWEMIRNHQVAMLYHGGQLDEIKSVVEFTKSLFLIP